MKRKTSVAESLAIFSVVGLVGAFCIALILTVSVGIFACLAMLLMNVIMPLFDVDYPLTWLQAFGVGGAILIIKAAVGGVVQK